ncbi:MAG: NAD(P)-dependent oxidoreductase [Pyrinomonadaceae bacterium]
MEHVLSTAMVNSPIILTNAKGCYAPEIGEHVFGLLFALTRGIALQAMQMGEKRWARRGGQLYELRGMTMGIVGFGGIGRETARRAKAMDMRVVGADIMPMHPEQVGHLAENLYLVDGGGLEKLLGESDVVVSAAPHTRKSEGMFGEREFALMKRGAYFNQRLARQACANARTRQSAHRKRLAGAGLDVT